MIFDAKGYGGDRKAPVFYAQTSVKNDYSHRKTGGIVPPVFVLHHFQTVDIEFEFNTKIHSRTFTQ